MAYLDHGNRTIAELTFEVTVRHYVEDGDPSPTEEDILVAVERHLNGHPDAVLPPFDVKSVAARRL
jgi:hypothetical protein